MGKPKFDSPEWRKAPIRAQINEALGEIERLREVWLDLLKIADLLDDYHREVIKLKQSEIGSNKPIDKWVYSKLANGALWAAEGELKRLKGWMVSLCESEIGLRAMLDPSFNGINIFQSMRNDELSRQASMWGHRKETTFLSKHAL